MDEKKRSYDPARTAKRLKALRIREMNREKRAGTGKDGAPLSKFRANCVKMLTCIFRKNRVE